MQHQIRVGGGGEGLLEEGQQDGDDDGGLEAFAEADEEDWTELVVCLCIDSSERYKPGTAKTLTIFARQVTQW